jgi:hypothetical protein
VDMQEVASQLSGELSRGVVVVGRDDRRIAASSPTTMAESHRLAVPIRGRAGTIGSFWLDAAQRPPLNSADYALIDAAAGLARDLLSDDPDPEPATTRDSIFALLLNDDVNVRRAALLDAVARGWLDRGKRTVVVAVMMDGSAGPLQRVAFGRHLAATAPSPTSFLGANEWVTYLVTRDTSGPFDLDDHARRSSSRFGVQVLAIGTAHHDIHSDDLADTARRARVAAELTSALPELQPQQDIEQLGGWGLVHAISAGSKRLADVSPAAELLCRSANRLQRETIETYLDAGAQVKAACELLHVHRTTLYYRLENMPAVVKDALNDGMKRSTLHLTLKLVRLWKMSDEI